MYCSSNCLLIPSFMPRRSLESHLAVSCDTLGITFVTTLSKWDLAKGEQALILFFQRLLKPCSRVFLEGIRVSEILCRSHCFSSPYQS